MRRVEIIPKCYPVEILDKDWSQRKCYFSQSASNYLSNVHDLEVRSDDVWLISLQKCGTTWIQELLWLLLNDCDLETAKSVDLELRTPYLEFPALINVDIENAFKPVENLKSPRLIKSHLPLPLLPKQLWQKKPKVIYIFRNPMDALVSMYHHNIYFAHIQNQTLEEYADWFYKHNAATLKPFDHVAEFYALRNEPWLYYTSFERMKQNLRSVIEDLCVFLNKTITEEQMQQMLKHLSFDEMKKNPMVQHRLERCRVRASLKLPDIEKSNASFIRKGQTNGFKDELAPATVEALNAWINDELKKHNLTLDQILLTTQS